MGEGLDLGLPIAEQVYVGVRGFKSFSLLNPPDPSLPAGYTTPIGTAAPARAGEDRTGVYIIISDMLLIIGNDPQMTRFSTFPHTVDQLTTQLVRGNNM